MRLPRPIVRAALVVASAAACSAAFPGGIPAQDLPSLARLDPASRAYAAALEEARALSARARAAGAIDTTPPVLNHIQVTGSIDAQAVNQSVDAAIDMTDDLSGVIKLVGIFRSPSGMQHVLLTIEPPAPTKSLKGTFTLGALPFADPPFTAFSEPGQWEADLLYAYDANGNSAGYSQNQLRALGSTTFQVNNAHYDIVAPALVGGTIATPQVRLSKPPKGTPTGTPPYVKAKISLTDSGNGRVSGVYYGRLILCADDCAGSFSMSGVASRTGLSTDTLTIGTELASKQRPGNYEIFALILDDVAGNETMYTSSAFGGETDFGDFFPDGTTITVDK